MKARNSGCRSSPSCRTEGGSDIFIAWVDGLNGEPVAIETLYPQTRVQLCMVHQVHNSLKYVS